MPFNALRVSVLLILSTIVWPAHAESLRCGSQLVNTDDHISEIYRKCGRPGSRANLGYIEVVDSYRRRSDVKVEEWVYGPWNGMYHYLTFRGDRLFKIESKRGQ
ncbi:MULTISPECIES: DUF2845 domain-containing protein [Pseudomonas]|jgi:hypothetical protein|uniref:DUF2845 domain-containing protein n=1 Tax=Pseudomonas luteola TaxID=47886 RepID=A0A2X2CX55_PSELU|nr:MULTISPECIES: DUF2845 domain-containing protein [Pseudomonas]ENA32906.1 hypothetical protein HMPREF1487_06634 [Pseudomonas sp. HPB0071]MBF8643296.1 DUF2845 domain-containing protein [Pseudomonas zeshuii]RRW42576.1 DUF2845 domain-containing protein [Pseudomonas luteola]SHJ53215.1 Protein of unknown function [Pseudomonas zeshuii]SPZ13362.1 Protein of uncharacterised function (DUF2845) [Pseudomonas luteola]